jgi:hypothetical protein
MVSFHPATERVGDPPTAATVFVVSASCRSLEIAESAAAGVQSAETARSTTPRFTIEKRMSDCVPYLIQRTLIRAPLGTRRDESAQAAGR